MKRWLIAFAVGLLVLLLAATPLFAVSPQGMYRKVHVQVETSDKEALMDALQRAFEGQGYRLYARTGIEVVMERKISGYLLDELWRIGSRYWDGDLRLRVKDPVEQVYLWIVRDTTAVTGIEAYRVLAANPDTAMEYAVLDDHPGRAEQLKQVLERIKAEVETGQK